MRNNVELLARFSKHGLSPAEYAVLSQTGFSPRPQSDVAWYSNDSIYCFGLPLTLPQCEAALASCLEKGWLFAVTESWLQGIQSTLESGQVIGPIRGLPSAGEIDVSKAGIDVLRRFRSDEPDKRNFDASALAYLERHPFVAIKELAFGEGYRKERGYSISRPNRDQVLLGYRDRGENVLQIGEPIQIGQWCVTWREILSEGYTMDIEIGQSPNLSG